MWTHLTLWPVCGAYSEQALVDLGSLHSPLPVWFFVVWCPLTSCQVHKPHSTNARTAFMSLFDLLHSPATYALGRHHYTFRCCHSPACYLLVLTFKLDLKQSMRTRGERIDSTHPLCALPQALWNHLCHRESTQQSVQTCPGASVNLRPEVLCTNYIRRAHKWRRSSPKHLSTKSTKFSVKYRM